MSVKLSRTQQIFFYIALALVNIIVMKDNVIYPISNTLYELFPDQTMGVNFMISGPALIIVISSLLMPYLLRVLSKRQLLVIGCIAFTITSVGGAWIVSLPYMISCRVIGGFCYGVSNVAAISIITDYFVDENKRATFMGIYQAAMAGIGALLGLISGVLVTSGTWKSAFQTYWLAAVMTVMVIVFVPKTESEEKGFASAQKSAQPYGRRFWIMLIDFVILSMCYSIPVLYFCSSYVTENALGDELFTGVLGSISTIGSAVVCVFFGFLYKKLKARTSLLSYILLLAGLAGMYFLPSRSMAIAATAISGGAFGNLFTYIYSHGSLLVPAEKVESSISIVTAVSSIALFVCTYLETALMSVLKTNRVTDTLPVLIILVIAAFILELYNTKGEA